MKDSQSFLLDEIQYERIIKYHPTTPCQCWFSNRSLRPNVALRYFYSKEHNKACCLGPCLRIYLSTFFDVLDYDHDKPKSIKNDYNTSFCIFKPCISENETDPLLLAVTAATSELHNIIEKHGTYDTPLRIAWLCEFIKYYTQRDDVSTISKLELYRSYKDIITQNGCDKIIERYISRNACKSDVQQWPKFNWRLCSLAMSPNVEISFKKNDLYIFDRKVPYRDHNILWNLSNNHAIDNLCIKEYKDKFTSPSYTMLFEDQYLKNYVDKYGCTTKEKLESIIYRPLSCHQSLRYIHIKGLNTKELLETSMCYLMINMSLTYDNVLKYIPSEKIMIFINRGIYLNARFLDIQLTDSDVFEYICKTLSAKRIQRHWRNCISNPDYVLCRKRLNAEFIEMI